MKRRSLALVSLLALALIVSGCKSSSKATSRATKPYEAKVTSVNKRAKKIKNESNVKKQVASLKKLENDSRDYQRGKRPYQQVKLAYQNGVKEVKQTIQTENSKKIKRESPVKFDKETQASLEKKNAGLKTIKAQLVLQRGVVYTASGFKKINRQIDQQIVTNQSQIKAYILSTKTAQKYIEANEEFTMKGNPKGLQRGSSTREKGFYAAIGLSKRDYWNIWSGIYDYYGNAADEGWITKAESVKAYTEAQRKLAAGDYATRPIDRHTMNFYEIEKGDYSALMGSWKEVAEGINASDTRGARWLSKTSGKRLTISKTSLTDGTVILRTTKDGNTTLTQVDAVGKTVGKPGEMAFSNPKSSNKGDRLLLSGEVEANSWGLNFYPRGSVEKDWPYGVANASKEHIEMGHPHFWEVFERE